jgi:hypothetical protein
MRVSRNRKTKQTLLSTSPDLSNNSTNDVYAEAKSRTKTTSHLRRPPPLHTFLPLVAPDRSRPRAERSQHKEEGGDGREPAHADGFDYGQTGRGAAGGEQVADHVVAGDDFGGLLFHDILRGDGVSIRLLYMSAEMFSRLTRQ